MYYLTRTGKGSNAINVSQALLTASLVGSVLNLANVLWEMYNAWSSSGDTLLEYLDALIRMQVRGCVPCHSPAAAACVCAWTAAGPTRTCRQALPAFLPRLVFLSAAPSRAITVR